ncbi:ComEA family DNA-binding protein [Cardinium endosymbiont of Culicoides punctatus]|uniref:ComEA family DNA-binding protein n=1 Tax=Cardinium endosymbiont of Culicoides punctatus TaxID=2304601 RepID=UPI00195B0E45|nr:helix-hairpin-helix domain-containing protein [Cardinium endosymbiont of Culicoides punctatus]
MKRYIKAAFHFSNSETNGFFAMIMLMLLLCIAPRAYKLYTQYYSKPLDHSKDIILLEKNLLLLKENARKVDLIDINMVTAQDLESISGLKQKLAVRIINYRNKLGGFVSLDQYKEVYGLSVHLQRRLMKQTTISEKYIPKQLSLNGSSFKAWVAHPYISPAIAKAIVDYRNHKQFTTIDDIEKLPVYHLNWAKKMMPYLSL